MIPRLTETHACSPTVVAFLAEVRAGGFSGEIATDYATRLLAATDNSIYQVLPEAVLFPRAVTDVSLVARLASEPRFAAVVYSPRGGGTGTNGQSLTAGVMVDVSRHMNRIVEVAADSTWARVQPGVVLDELNAYLAPRGVFFAPNVSPSNRATIGGMVNTDACGQGSRVYGRTSDHVVSLEVVLTDGAVWTTGPLSAAALAEAKALPGRIGEIHRVVDGVVTEHADLISRGYRPLARFMTGYNLARVRDRGEAPFNLCFLMSGSEGTLGIVTEITVRLVPIPAAMRLVSLRYRSFDDALANARLLLDAEPSAIETIDDTILGLARHDAIYHRVARFLDEDGAVERTAAINLVEFTGPDEASVAARVEALLSAVEAARAQEPPPVGTPSGWALADGPGEAQALWDLRKKGVGLLGAVEGARKPIPFVEDTVVPPEHLAHFVREFRAILDRHGLQYGMFGHVDVGCLHVRPALDLKDPADEVLVRRITDEVAALVDRFGGVLWGEHGKGMRSEFNPRYFGAEVYALMQRVKAAFDPRNQLNPGKLATPEGGQAALATIDGAPLRGHFDRQIAPEYQEQYAVALSCNGNGACYTYDPNSVMCPSSKVTRDRVHSPKGRASVMREWLRQLSRAGYVRGGNASRRSAPLQGLVRWWRTWQSRRESTPDYSHQVYAAMSGCLACKACATQCPVKVDVPAFRAEFLALYHERYARPLRDHFVALLESVLPWLAKAPRLANAVMHNPLGAWLSKRGLGIVDSPRLSHTPWKALLEERGAELATAATVAAWTAKEPGRVVVLVPDAFTAFYEAPIAVAAFDVLRAWGARVLVAPFEPNGKGLHVKGFLGRFEVVARAHAKALLSLQRAGASLVVVEPAVALTYRDEYPHALGESIRGLHVHLLQEWLSEHLDWVSPRAAGDAESWALFGHCTEKTLAPKAQSQWAQVFSRLGATLRLAEVGCCGMCGIFGHELMHLGESKGIWEMSWAGALQRTAGGARRALATGHSCRSQAKRFGAATLRHPAQVLVELLRATPALPPPGEGRP